MKDSKLFLEQFIEESNNNILLEISNYVNELNLDYEQKLKQRSRGVIPVASAVSGAGSGGFAEDSEIINESDISFTIRNAGRIISNMMKNAKNTGNFKGLRKNLLKMVESCKNMSEVNYLRKDISNGIVMLTKLKESKPEIKEQCEEHIEWLKTEYREALNNKAKQLKEKDIHLKEDMLLNENLNNKNIFHLSYTNLNEKVLTPKIPSNFFTKNGFEENKTPRVCFAKNIDGCLRGFSKNLTDIELFVHVPMSDVNLKYPTTKEVPDSKVTGEIWCLNKVKVKCIGKIKVIKDKGEDGIQFKYGNNTAELYDWEWKWIEKY